MAAPKASIRPAQTVHPPPYQSGVSWGPMKYLGIGALCILALVAGSVSLYSRWTNTGVIRELRENPDGEKAQRVMLLTLPSGKALPVNYLRDTDTVYAAADFPWWRELRNGSGRGTVLIRGETLHGSIRAVEDDPELRKAVFSRLRPSAPLWAGTLVEITLD